MVAPDNLMPKFLVQPSKKNYVSSYHRKITLTCIFDAVEEVKWTCNDSELKSREYKVYKNDKTGPPYQIKGCS